MNTDKYKAFQLTSICRADLEQAGFDSTKFSDSDMEYLASKMADAYMENFWTDLEIIGDNIYKK